MDKETLEQRIDILFKQDAVPVRDETAIEAMESGWFKIALTSQRVSQMKYSKEYACFNFSKDFRDLLLKKGIPSKIDIVKVKPKDPRTKDYHAIISIQIDPQTGDIVYYRTEDLIDQCFEAKKDGKYYCNKGQIIELTNKVEVYDSGEN